MEKGDHTQGFVNPPWKNEVWRESRTATLHCVSDQTRGTKGLVENHSAIGPIVAGGSQVVEEEGPVVEDVPPCGHQADAPTCPGNPELSGIKEQAPAQEEKIKLPKAAKEWNGRNWTFTSMRYWKGSVESRLNLFRDILCQECKDRFGVVTIKKSTIPRQKGWQERERLSSSSINSVSFINAGGKQPRAREKASKCCRTRPSSS